jgi:hypothetical protein
MILIDEHEYDSWKRSPVDSSKTQLSNELQSQLNSTNLPDDIKAKQYQETLNRFLNIKQLVPEQHPTEVNGVIIPNKSLKKAAKRVKRGQSPARRTSRRKKIPWTLFNDE